MKIMDMSINLFCRVNLVIFVCFTYSYPGAGTLASSSQVNNTLDAIVACDAVKFLRNSSYIKECNTLPYPVEFKQDQDDKDMHFMCKTLNHITNKICEYRVMNNNLMKMPENASRFDQEMKKLEPKHEDRTSILGGWCLNMTVLFNASILNDSNAEYVKYAKNILLDQTECIGTCQVRFGVNNFCVVFFWFNQLYNTLESSRKTNISKETVISKVGHTIENEDYVEKPLVNADNNDKHSSILDPKVNKDQSKLQIPEMDVQNNESTELNKQEMKKALDQSDHEAIRQQQQYPNSKLPSSTDDDLNKPEFQEAIDSFLDKEGKKKEVAEGDDDRGIMETNKKDSYNDSGDERGFLDSPVIKEQDESHFFIYFSIISFACVLLYIGYHNKQKILAMVLEGRQSRRSRGNRRRPNTANYRKLDSNLEEAVTSQCNSNVTHVIY